MADTLNIFGTEYSNVTGIIATTPNETDLTYIRPQGTKSISANGTGINVAEYASVDVNVPSGQPNLQNKTKTYTPTESTQTESVSADSGYDGLDTVSISVGAISNTYVGSGITRRSSTDLTASGATVTVPSGYYSVNASKSVANGSVTAPSSISGTSATVSTGTNTLTLTKSVSVTPNVTTAGYISSGTAGNASVSLTASVTTKAAATITPSTSEQSIAAGTYLTGKQTISAMPSGTAGTPTATKGAVSNHSVNVTPSVTNTTGYITGSTKTGTAVSVSASELVSGTKSITENGTGIDVTNYASVDVSVGGGGGASNVVGGTYITGNGGSAETITLPYTGNGFPMQIVFSLAEGTQNSSGTAYNTIHQYGIAYFVYCKINTTAPTYAYDDSNTVSRYIVYKSSPTTANTLSGNAATMESYVFSPNSASSSVWGAVVQINSSTALSVYVSSASGTRGLMPNTAYNYSVVYSE